MKILVSALETSSNIHLAALTKHLSSEHELIGIYDKSLGNPNYDITQLAIMGFVDAIKKLPFFLKLKKEMVELARDADKILLMDASGFNLPLAKSIRKKYPEKEIIYYILPQAWVWKKGRIKKLEKICDKLCSIIPFEQKLYSNKEKISYVGHPLLDEIHHFKSNLNASGTIAFMPGSRKTEITNHMPVFRELSKKFNDKTLLLIIPEKFDDIYIEKTYGDISNFTISRDTHSTLQEAEFAFICSGTATLEAALIGTPFILSYIAKSFDYFIGSKIVKIPYIGLANIFFDKMGKPIIHKELFQENVTADSLYEEYSNMDREKFFQNSQVLRDYLQNGSSLKVAQIIQN